MDFHNSTITIKFADQIRNHAGMQELGEMCDTGFSKRHLKRAKRRFDKLGVKCELIDLVKLANVDKDTRDSMESAYVLIMRNAVSTIIDKDSKELFDELADLDVDKKVLIYDKLGNGKVVNKKSCYNVCFAHKDQEPDYEEGKGRVIKFKHVPLLNKVRKSLADYITKGDEEWPDLLGEGNFYYDTEECGIFYHGDYNRKRLIALRLGKSMNLVHQWYLGKERIGNKIELMLNNGDMYIMSEKTVGFDWKDDFRKKNKIPRLRHAAGCKKYTK